MAVPINAKINQASVRALADHPLDWSFKGIPPRWWGQTPAQILMQAPRLVASDTLGPMCVLLEDALVHNLHAMARWCAEHAVELAPHGKTHMSPQLAARQLDAGACSITVATIGQAAVYRAFGVRDLLLANELVDEAGLRWLAAELDRDDALRFLCWVDSVRGVELMTTALAGARRCVDVCVEVGLPHGRSGCRSRDHADRVARAAAASPGLRLVGIAGYEAALGHDLSTAGTAVVSDHLAEVRMATLRLADEFEADDIVVTAGGSTHFDAVAAALTGWPAGMSVRTILRSGCYLTHDHGLYARTSPLTRDGRDGLHPALQVRAQVVSLPEPGLAILTLGRRDVPFDKGLPVPLDLPDSAVVTLNDQHAFLKVHPSDRSRVQVGGWLRFGISHPCGVFDRWKLIPVVDAQDRVVDMVRTFF